MNTRPNGRSPKRPENESRDGGFGLRPALISYEPQIVNAAQNANGIAAKAHIATHAIFSYSKARSRAPCFSVINAIAHAPDTARFRACCGAPLLKHALANARPGDSLQAKSRNKEIFYFFRFRRGGRRRIAA
jgi:hypothetical protein